MVIYNDDNESDNDLAFTIELNRYFLILSNVVHKFII